MTEHPNAVAIRRMFQAFREADAETLRELIPEEIVWRFPGRRGKLAGEHRGRDAVFTFLLNVQTLSGGTFHLDLIDALAAETAALVCGTPAAAMLSPS